MADTVFSELPVAVALSGAEIVPLSVPTGLSQAPYTSERTTVGSIWAQFGGTGGMGACSLRQWLEVVAAIGTGAAQALFDAIPADVGSSLWIQYNRGSRVVVGDILYLETQIVFAYSSAQMLALMAAAQALPF
jgi:hypothetical protein